MPYIGAYHTLTDPGDPVHHVYDDCPAGKVVIRNGNNIAGDNGWDMCQFCTNKLLRGEFSA